MQTLEDLKETPYLVRLNPDPIVTYGKHPLLLMSSGGDMDIGRCCSTKLQCVGEEILQYLPQARLVTGEGWQGVMRNRSTAFGNSTLQVPQDTCQQRLPVHRCAFPALT